MKKQFTHTKSFEVTTDVHNYIEQLRIRLATRMSWGFFILFILLTFAYYVDSFESAIMMTVGVGVCLGCLIYLKISKKSKPVFITYSSLGFICTSYALLNFNETIHLVDVLWMLAAISIGFFSVGKLYGYTLLFLSLIVITFFIMNVLNVHILTVEPRTYFQKITLVIEMLSGFLINFYIFYLYTSVHAYSNRKLRKVNEQLVEQNEMILQQNNEKSILVKEVHHRVKNNLQIVVSLLRLQMNELSGLEVKSHFQESINRVMSMALIHQKLYQQESLSQVLFVEYANDLLAAIIRTDSARRKIQFHVISEEERLGLKSLVPIGLIINELVLNSLKHAFGTMNEGQIHLQVLKTDDPRWIQVVYKDSGTWKEREVQNTSFGMTLIETLVEQLDGNLSINKLNDGTQFVMKLRNLVEADITA